MEEFLNLIVKNKEGVLFKGQVKAITSFNERGEFDILPEHENFISVINNKIIIRKAPKENQEIEVENGMLKVYKNDVNIYIGI